MEAAILYYMVGIPLCTEMQLYTKEDKKKHLCTKSTQMEQLHGFMKEGKFQRRAQELVHGMPMPMPLPLGTVTPKGDLPTETTFTIFLLMQRFFANKEQGSKADIVALFWLSYESNYTVLPAKDARALEQMHVHVQYIPKSPHENFYRTNVDKFRILGLTQYRRVLFMDGDVFSLGSLDYLFEMSDGKDAILKENVVMQGVFEPANGGFFMLAPSAEDLSLINSILQCSEEYSRQAPYPFFDWEQGWGHKIEPPEAVLPRVVPIGHFWLPLLTRVCCIIGSSTSRRA